MRKPDAISGSECRRIDAVIESGLGNVDGVSVVDLVEQVLPRARMTAKRVPDGVLRQYLRERIAQFLKEMRGDRAATVVADAMRRQREADAGDVP
jgi:hypothetical protein